LIVVDGQREIGFGLKAGLKVVEIFYCPSLHKSKDDLKLLVNKNKFKLTEVSEPVFKKICYKENPDGFLAVAQRPQTALPELERVDRDILVVVLENVEKPGNLGAIIRSAYAASVDYIIINNAQTDIYNPNVIRASEGYIFKLLPIEISVPDTISWLKKNKIRTLGASTSTKKEYTKANLGGRVAIVLGSEAEGLSRNWLELADDLIKIPMRSDVDSLNVSVSAAIIIFEALRQRSVNKKA
ncbi:MAG: RNA methyltransferase, TrmH family, partial [Parcubacteria group bacterium Athens0714_26]